MFLLTVVAQDFLGHGLVHYEVELSGNQIGVTQVALSVHVFTPFVVQFLAGDVAPRTVVGNIWYCHWTLTVFAFHGVSFSSLTAQRLEQYTPFFVTQGTYTMWLQYLHCI